MTDRQAAEAGELVEEARHFLMERSVATEHSDALNERLKKGEMVMVNAAPIAPLERGWELLDSLASAVDALSVRLAQAEQERDQWKATAEVLEDTDAVRDLTAAEAERRVVKTVEGLPPHVLPSETRFFCPDCGAPIFPVAASGGREGTRHKGANVRIGYRVFGRDSSSDGTDHDAWWPLYLDDGPQLARTPDEAIATVRERLGLNGESETWVAFAACPWTDFVVIVPGGAA